VGGVGGCAGGGVVLASEEAVSPGRLFVDRLALGGRLLDWFVAREETHVVV
jgi:hypothetical protein